MQPGLGAYKVDRVDHVACSDGHHEDVHPLKVLWDFLLKDCPTYNLSQLRRWQDDTVDEQVSEEGDAADDEGRVWEELVRVIIAVGPVDFHGATLGHGNVVNHDGHTLSVTLDQALERLGLDFKNCFVPASTLSFTIWISSDSLLKILTRISPSRCCSTWMSTRQIKTKRLDCALDSHTSSRLDITEVSHCHTQIWRTRHHLASSKHKGNNKGKPNFQNYKNLVCPPNIRYLMTNYDVFRSRRKIKIIK